MEIIEIKFWQLLLCVGLVIVAGFASVRLHLGLEKDMAWATVRTFAQLFLLGYVLRFVFDLDHAVPVLLVLVGMTLFAAWTISGRVKERRVPVLLPVSVTMVLSYVLITFFATSLVVGVDPWYSPQYVVPIGGMVVGNSMNAIAVALERLFAAFRKEKQRVDLFLSLGATSREASQSGIAEAIRAGMIPTINSMMTVGIVFIPGMMTGQILAGADPLLAIRYQIMIMLLILISTSAGSILVVLLVARMCFTRAHQLKL